MVTRLPGNSTSRGFTRKVHFVGPNNILQNFDYYKTLCFLNADVMNWLFLAWKHRPPPPTSSPESSSLWNVLEQWMGDGLALPLVSLPEFKEEIFCLWHAIFLDFQRDKSSKFDEISVEVKVSTDAGGLDYTSYHWLIHKGPFHILLKFKLELLKPCFYFFFFCCCVDCTLVSLGHLRAVFEDYEDGTLQRKTAEEIFLVGGRAQGFIPMIAKS